MLQYDWNDRPERIPVAGSCIIETAESGQGVFLTRRAGHLRTFPRLWVPPGGHVDQHETMETAIKREVEEETGLSSDDSHKALLHSNFTKLCAWESAYPGVAVANVAPKRHHLVVYFLAKLKQNLPTLDPNRIDPDSELLREELDFKPPLFEVNLEEKEVSSCVWLSRAQAQALVQDANDADKLFRVCDPADFASAGKLVRQAFKGRSLDSLPEKFLRDTSWRHCLEFPTADLVQRLGPCWYWHVSTKQWILRPFGELFQGMISGFRTPSQSPERPANSSFIPSPPSRCSIGCLFAIESWLKLTHKQ
ncbi:nudix (nucleoside diphosphate linked moiety X)-type motif 17 [Cichlidogyrus casuarinus]|uniref:Nudix (Nucleoside diphosphate linked moiety X)-type motif 17 n=1 Tax=Cichlidogyrus casuarinus TaxID=1844966 RepID=A0ABD2QGS0_9PLAT